MEEKRFIKLLFLLPSKWAIKILAKKMGVKNVIFDKLHDLFSKAKRIDFFPCQSDSRGFIIILDRETALFFNQDGDHFVYDGYEMGEYEKGDVGIFDNLK